MNSLISPHDHWTLWTILVATASLSIFLEQKNKIAAKLTGPVLALIFGLLMSNLGMIPTSAAAYDVVWDYIVPLAIPLLLMKMDIRKIIKKTGRMFGAFHLSALGTMLGAIIAVALFRGVIVEVAKLGGIMTASYIGGGVNFVAMVSTFKPPETLVNAAIVADNGAMAIYFLVLISLPAMAFMKKQFLQNSDQSREADRRNSGNGAQAYWKPKPISLLDIAVSLGLAFLIALLSVKLSAYFASTAIPIVLRSVLSQKYLLLTTFSIAFPLIFPRFTDSLAGSEEIGTFFIYLFFVLIGIPASLKTVILNSPVLLLFCALMLMMNFFVTFGLGKLFRFKLEELILAAAASSGGPMNAAAIAISKGWHKLVFPSFLIGIWGYVIGNYIGYIMGVFLAKLLN